MSALVLQRSASTTDSVQTPCQIRSSAVRCFASVARVILKELSLMFKSGCDGSLLIDVALTTVHNRNVSEAQRDDASSEDIDDVGALVPAR